MVRRMLSDSLLLPHRRTDKERSRSPSYLRHARTGERSIRRSGDEADELVQNKVERKIIVGSSLDHSTMPEKEKLVKGSLSNETNTSRTADDSFCSVSSSSAECRGATSSSPPTKRNRMSKNSRTSRNAFILVSPNRTPRTLKKKKSGRRISLQLDHQQASLPIIEAFDEEKAYRTIESTRGRKKEKDSTNEVGRETKTKKKKLSTRSKSVGVSVDANSTKSQKEKKKKKEKRNKSIGPATSVEKQRSESATGHAPSADCTKKVTRSLSRSTAATVCSSENFVSHDGRPVTIHHWKSEAALKSESPRSRSSSKVRTTVDENGKIRRIKAEVSHDYADGSSRETRRSKSNQRSKASAALSRSPRQKKAMLEASERSKSLECLSSLDNASFSSRSSIFQRQISESSLRSHRSQSVRDGTSPKINPIKSADLKKEIDSLQEELLSVKAEHSVGMAEVARANRDLRKTRLELQKSITEKGELRLQIQDKDQCIKEKLHKIEVLEKAVESQLDKVDELEEELRQAYEDIFKLESRIACLAGMKHDDELEGDQIKSDSKRRLIELKSKKEEALESRSQHLQDETERILSQMPQQDINQLLKENETLRRALQEEKRKADMADKREFSVDGEPDDSRITIQGEKNDSIKKMKLEVAQLRQQLCESQNASGLHNPVAAKEEARLMKTKWEGAQRRNMILEEDIHHWKSVNCTLEEELDEMKAQAAMWKAKCLTAACAAGTISSFGGDAVTGLRSAADISMMRRDERGDEDDGSQNSIASFWSKLTKSNSVRSMNQSFHSANSVEGTISKSIF